MSNRTDKGAAFNGYRIFAISDLRAQISTVVDDLVRDGQRVVLSRQGKPIAFIAPLGDLYELDDVDAQDSRDADAALAEHRLEQKNEREIRAMIRKEVSKMLPPGSLRQGAMHARFAMPGKAPAKKTITVKSDKRSKAKAAKSAKAATRR